MDTDARKAEHLRAEIDRRLTTLKRMVGEAAELNPAHVEFGNILSDVQSRAADLFQLGALLSHVANRLVSEAETQDALLGRQP